MPQRKKGTAARYTDDFKEAAALRYHETDEFMQETADAVGVSVTSLRRWIRERGLGEHKDAAWVSAEVARRKRKDDLYAVLYCQDKLSVAQVAERSGDDWHMVYRSLRRRDLLRSREEGVVLRYAHDRDDELTERVLFLYEEQELSMTVVSDIVGISKDQGRTIVNREGEGMRSTSEARRLVFTNPLHPVGRSRKREAIRLARKVAEGQTLGAAREELGFSSTKARALMNSPFNPYQRHD